MTHAQPKCDHTHRRLVIIDHQNRTLLAPMPLCLVWIDSLNQNVLKRTRFIWFKRLLRSRAPKRLLRGRAPPLFQREYVVYLWLTWFCL